MARRRQQQQEQSDNYGDTIFWILLIITAYYVWKSNPNILDSIKSFLENLTKGVSKPSLPGETTTPSTTPSTFAPSGTGGGSGQTVYQTTGKVMQAQGTGAKTRHYASGKPDDTTQEWNGESCPSTSENRITMTP